MALLAACVAAPSATVMVSQMRAIADLRWFPAFGGFLGVSSRR
jgi:hypothetical protein